MTQGPKDPSPDSDISVGEEKISRSDSEDHNFDHRHSRESSRESCRLAHPSDFAGKLFTGFPGLKRLRESTLQDPHQLSLFPEDMIPHYKNRTQGSQTKTSETPDPGTQDPLPAIPELFPLDKNFPD